DRYLVATGDWNNTATWSDSSGGSPGSSFPVAGDNVFCDANSGASVLTVNVASACLGFNCTGFTGTLAGTSGLSVGGSLTLGAGMTLTYSGAISFTATSTGHTITTNGVALGGGV